VKRFEVSNNPYKITIPRGVSSITINVAGASGGSDQSTGSKVSHGGYGGVVIANFKVYHGLVLYIYVGGMGKDNTCIASSCLPLSESIGGGGGAGFLYKFSDGRSTYSTLYGGASGGGSSDIRTIAGDLKSRIIVAGGGGGGGGRADCCSKGKVFKNSQINI
jgi:hypothetical protein